VSLPGGCYAQDEMHRLASVGATLTLALLAYGCGTPHIQQSGIVAHVYVVGGIAIRPESGVIVTLAADSPGFSETRQVTTGAAGVTVPMDLPPGHYQVSEALGDIGVCSSQTLEVTLGPSESVRLSCDVR
jgi:hypothetical protein